MTGDNRTRPAGQVIQPRGDTNCRRLRFTIDQKTQVNAKLCRLGGMSR